jgi:hypothetical protein
MMMLANRSQLLKRVHSAEKVEGATNVISSSIACPIPTFQTLMSRNRSSGSRAGFHDTGARVVLMESGGLSLERRHETTDVTANHDLVPVETDDFVWGFSNRWQMISFHVRTSAVVVVHKFRNDVIQVPFAEKDELEKALVFDRLNESLNTPIEVRRGHRQNVGTDSFRL